MTFRGLIPLFALTLCLAAVGGCSSTSGKGTVAGEVTFDGQPLKEGVIRFVPVDGKSPTADTACPYHSFA